MAIVLIAVARVPSTNPHLSPFSWLLYNILSKKQKAQMPHKYIKYQVLEWKKNLNKAVFNLNRADFLRK